MNVELIKKTKYIIISLGSIIIFIDAQIRPATISGETASSLSALTMALVVFFLQFMLTSDYIHNNLRENGLHVNYKLFQRIGLFLGLIFLYITANAYFISHL